MRNTECQKSYEDKDKNKLRKENGSVSLFVLISCLFFLFIATGVYMNLVNKDRNLNAQISKIQENYELDKEKIYNQPESPEPPPDKTKLWVETEKDTSTSKSNNWYAYTNLTTGEVAKVNEPKLQGNMTPIKYDGEISTDFTSRWANAVTTDGSMWVWIPRYAYRITEGYHTGTAGTIDIAFIDEDNNFLNDDQGSTDLVVSPSEVTYSGSQQEQWLVHPTFTEDASTGGGFGNLTGIWVAKFEVSGSNKETDGYKIQGGVASLGGVVTGDYYYYSMRQTYGEDGITLNDEGSASEHTSFGNSHMMKNSEWGATIYLTYSKYGVNKAEVKQNENENFYTGGTSIVEDIYDSSKTYVELSSTHNAYGIYDLSGGVYEKLASYLDNGMYYLTNNGKELYDVSPSVSTKYKTVYKSVVVSDREIEYEEAEKMKGDAIYETSYSGIEQGGSWGNVHSLYPYEWGPFFMRGGCNALWDNGIFNFNASDGSGLEFMGCRVVLAF